MERRQNYITEQLKPNENCEQSDNSYFYCAVAPVGSPPPELTGGFTAFPANAPQIFSLQQSLVTLAFNTTKLQPQNPRVWRRLWRIFAMLAKERKEAKEALMEFLGFDDDDGDEGVICAEVLMLPKWFEEWILWFTKSSPHDISAAWLCAVIPRLRRAPDLCLRVAG